MKALDPWPIRGLFWEGNINGTEYRVGFNAPQYYYIPGICHKDHACRSFLDYGDECFGWGYKGRGPKQLALTILIYTQAKAIKDSFHLNMCHKADIAIALKHHVAFMEEVISKLPDKWELTEEFIMDWLKDKEAKDNGILARENR